MDFDTIWAAIQSWDIDQRVLLAHSILQQVNFEMENAELTEAQIAELERRLADDDADPDGGIPWETVRAEALKRLNPKH